MANATTPSRPAGVEQWGNLARTQEGYHAHRRPPAVPAPQPATKTLSPQSEAPCEHHRSGKGQAVNAMQVLPWSDNTGNQQQRSHHNIPHEHGGNKPPTRIPRRRQLQYKPFALRWPFLTGLFLSLFTLAGLLAVSLRVLPIQYTDSLGNQMAKRALAGVHQRRDLSPVSGLVDVRNITLPTASHNQMINMGTASLSAAGSPLPTTSTPCGPRHAPCEAALKMNSSTLSPSSDSDEAARASFLASGTGTVISHRKSAVTNTKSVAATTGGALQSVLTELEEHSTTQLDASITRLSETNVTTATLSTAPSSTAASAVRSQIASAMSSETNNADMGALPPNVFLQLGPQIVAVRPRKASSPTSSWNISLAAGKTSTTMGATATAALPSSSSELVPSSEECCADGMVPEAFLPLGRETIHLRSNSRQDVEVSAPAAAPRADSFRPSVSRLTGLDHDTGAGVRFPGFLKLHETIVLRDNGQSERGPTSTTMAILTASGEPRTSMTAPLMTSVVQMSPEIATATISKRLDYQPSGVKPQGLLPVDKETLVFADETEKRLVVPLADRPSPSRPEQASFHAVQTTTLEACSTRAVPEISASLAPEYLSKPNGASKPRYLFRNQSVTSHPGRHEMPISSSRPTHRSSSATKSPLSTSQAVPNTNTAGVVIEVYDLTMGTYFVCFFLPTLLCTLLQIPVRLIDQHVRLLQPFHAMTDRDGSAGRDSLWLATAGWRCRAASLRNLFSKKQSLVFLTGVLQILTWLVVTFSATAVGLELVGSGCQQGDPYSVEHNCAMVPAIFLRPTIILLTLLGSMIVVLAVIMARLATWETGVHEDPWSIAGTARLSLHKELRSRMQLATPGTAEEREEQSSRFSLRYSYGEKKTVEEYGIVPLPTARAPASRNPRLSGVKSLVTSSSTWVREKSRTFTRTEEMTRGREIHEVPFTLGYTGRISFLVFMCGLMVVILYYRNVNTPSGFEDFMDDESYGVTILFTGVGSITTEFWSSFSEGKFTQISPTSL